MAMVCTALSVVLVFALTVGASPQLERIVTDVMNCSEIQSLSLAMVYNNIKYARDFVTIQDKTQIFAKAERIFCIGGATQAFTAVLLTKLLDKHSNVTWETPIRDIVSHKIELPYPYLSENLNLKDIFAMRSGLAGMDIVTAAKPFAVDELIAKLRYVPPVAGFRERFVYNEVLFSLLEEVLIALGGDTWQNLITEHIFQPLNMTSTTFLESAYGKPNHVKGSVRYLNISPELNVESYSGLELVAPAVSVCTTADDMQRWFDFLLNGGKVGNRVVVDQAALEATYVAVQPRGKDVDPVEIITLGDQYSRDSNAIGWINGVFRGYSFVSQDGSIPGYQTLATIIPARKVAVYVAFNSDRDAKRFAAKVLLNMLGISHLLQGKTTHRSEDLCAIIRNVSNRKKKAHETIQRISTPVLRPLEDYVGTYRNYAYGDVHVNSSEKSIDATDSGLTLQYGLADYKMYTTNRNNTFQLIAQGGGLWYSTQADWYRLNQEIFAEFFSDSQDPHQRFSSVRIDGFDRHHVPEFSTNAQPPHFDKYTDYCRCSASLLAAWQWTILLAITLMHFS